MEQNQSKLSISHALSIGWQGMKKNFWGLLVFGIIILFIALITSLVNYIGGGRAAMIIQIVLSVVIVLVLQPLITVARKSIALNIVEGGVVSWKAFVVKARVWWKILIASIVYALMVCFGTLLLIVPGIIIGLMYSQVIYVIVDNPKLGIVDAFSKSARLTKGVRWKLLGFFFVQIGVILLGIIALGIGIIVSFMVIFVAKAAIYVLLKKSTLGADNTDEIPVVGSIEGGVDETEEDEHSSDELVSEESASLVEIAPKGKSWVSWLVGGLGILIIVLAMAAPIALLSLNTMRGNAIDSMYQSQMYMMQENTHTDVFTSEGYPVF